MTVKHGIQRKRGMTLVELLVAISIIAILAGILIPVIRSAMMRGQVASVKMEIASLTTALEGHKLEYGGYPPDGSNPALVIQHFRNMFKRADAVEQAILTYLVTTYGLDPAESLVFFLGGFSDNPLKPLTGPGGPFSGNRKSGMMDFDPNRVTSTGQVSVLSVPLQGGNTIDIKVVASNDTDNDPFPTYLPANLGAPYVYFDSRTYAVAFYMPKFQPSPQYQSIASPYHSDHEIDTNNDLTDEEHAWINPDSFQLICAGIDDDFGLSFFGSVIAGQQLPPRILMHYPSGLGHYFNGQNNVEVSFSAGDKSNITNFSANGTIEDDLP